MACPLVLAVRSLAPGIAPETLLAAAVLDEFAPASIAGLMAMRTNPGTTTLFSIHSGRRASKPWVVGRKRFGRIAIANSDAAATAETDAAIDQAHRAVQEILHG
jgi:hypothetical protein